MTFTAPSSTAVASSRTNVMFGCASTRSVMSCANCCRSTASAAPAGTFVRIATSSTTEAPRRNSSFKRYGAVPGSSDFRELEQTISQPVRPVRGRLPDGAHLVEPHPRAFLRRLPRGLHAREPPADDQHILHTPIVTAGKVFNHRDTETRLINPSQQAVSLCLCG